MIVIDLRSDTVTKPSEAMKRAMFEAETGDDVYGEDPTVNKLEKLAATVTGMENALFVSSGTQSNLLALLSHCERGDEYITGQGAHTYIHEGGGAAVLGSIQPQPIEEEADGTLDLEKVAGKIKPLDDHFARTVLLCLENTHNGRVLPLDYLSKAQTIARSHGLKLHLDGARVFNAAVKLGIDVRLITQNFDSVSICLSKGLGAPVGSVLCSSKEVIKKARRWRKVLGGGMRQAGVIAAAGIYALNNNTRRLKDDHENAQLLAEGLRKIPGLSDSISQVQTNMVFISIGTDKADRLKDYLKQKNIMIGGYGNIRLVTHLDMSREDIERVIIEFNNFFDIS